MYIDLSGKVKLVVRIPIFEAVALAE